MLYTLLVNRYCHVVVFLISDIYCTSVCPRMKDPSSVVLPEVSQFSLFRVYFFKFFLTWFEVLRAEDVISVQFVKEQ